jgi:hypothetical protein
LVEYKRRTNKNGEDYQRILDTKGRPDVRRKIRDVIPRIQRRLNEIDRDFAERYGHTINPEINQQFREEERQREG